jgi:hypothetical protein
MNQATLLDRQWFGVSFCNGQTNSVTAADPSGRAVCGRTPAEIAGSNLAGALMFCLL